MLSKKSGQLYQAVLKWCNTYGGMPFIWNGRRGKVSLTRKGEIRFGLSIILQSISCIFIALRMVQIVSHFSQSSSSADGISSRWKAVNSSKLVNSNSITRTSLRVQASSFKQLEFDIGITYCFLYAMVHIYLVAVLLNTIGKYKELVLFINSYLKFTTHFREAYAIRLPRSWHNGCEEWVQIMIAFAVLVPLLPTIHFLLNPLHPQFFTSVLVPFVDDAILNYNTNLPTITSEYGMLVTAIAVGTFAVFQIFYIWSVASALLFVTVNAIISSYVFNSALKEMTIISSEHFPISTSHNRNSKGHSRYVLTSPYYVTRDKLRTCHSLVKCYRSFQIIQTLAHQAFSGLVFTTEFLQIAFNSFAVTTLVRFFGTMSTGSVVLLLLWILLNCSTWTFILSIVGRFEKKSQRCCQSWKHIRYNFVEEIRYMKLVKKSCHPIVISAKFFQIRIRHVPRFLYCIVCGSVVWSVVYQIFMGG